MLTTLDLLNLCRLRVMKLTGKGSTYRLAKEIGCPRASIYQWENGHTIGPKYAANIGYFLGIDPRYCVLCAEYERAPTDELRFSLAAAIEALRPAPTVFQAIRKGDHGGFSAELEDPCLHSLLSQIA